MIGIAQLSKLREVMGDQSNSEPAIPAVPATESGKTEGQVVFTGENVMKLLHQATGLAGGKQPVCR